MFVPLGHCWLIWRILWKTFAIFPCFPNFIRLWLRGHFRYHDDSFLTDVSLIDSSLIFVPCPFRSPWIRVRPRIFQRTYYRRGFSFRGRNIQGTKNPRRNDHGTYMGQERILSCQCILFKTWRASCVKCRMNWTTRPLPRKWVYRCRQTTVYTYRE